MPCIRHDRWAKALITAAQQPPLIVRERGAHATSPSHQIHYADHMQNFQGFLCMFFWTGKAQ